MSFFSLLLGVYVIWRHVLRLVLHSVFQVLESAHAKLQERLIQAEAELARCREKLNVIEPELTRSKERISFFETQAQVSQRQKEGVAPYHDCWCRTNIPAPIGTNAYQMTLHSMQP